MSNMLLLCLKFSQEYQTCLSREGSRHFTAGGCRARREVNFRCKNFVTDYGQLDLKVPMPILLFCTADGYISVVLMSTDWLNQNVQHDDSLFISLLHVNRKTILFCMHFFVFKPILLLQNYISTGIGSYQKYKITWWIIA